jgi:hypothetical protein
MSRVRTSVDGHRSRGDRCRSDAGEDRPVERNEPTQALTARAGEVAAAERERALRTFDDCPVEVRETARRALSTMAVRIAVQVIEPAVVAAAADDRTGETVADLFRKE